MVKDHGTPKAEQLFREWARGCTETENRQRASGPKSPQPGSAK